MILFLVLTFFFSSSRYHRDLHSFPTRRSSDLLRQPRPHRCPCLLHEGRTLRDRKSTRLNSSHVSISYAVFCLKKKITIFYPHLRKQYAVPSCFLSVSRYLYL